MAPACCQSAPFAWTLSISRSLRPVLISAASAVFKMPLSSQFSSHSAAPLPFCPLLKLTRPLPLLPPAHAFIFRFKECPVCRKDVSDAQLLYLEVKPRPKVPSSPRKAPRSTADEADEVDAKPHFRPSTKLRALKVEIDAMAKHDPESKCIIFSQWTTMLDLVEVRTPGAGSWQQAAGCRTAASIFLNNLSPPHQSIVLQQGHAGGNRLRHGPP